MDYFCSNHILFINTNNTDKELISKRLLLQELAAASRSIAWPFVGDNIREYMKKLLSKAAWIIF